MVADLTIRIDIVAPFPPPYGGMGVRFSLLVDNLIRRGYVCNKINLESGKGEGLVRLFMRLFSFVKCFRAVLISKGNILHTTTGSVPNAYFISLIGLAGRLSGKKTIVSVAGGEFLLFSQKANPLQRISLQKLLSFFDLIIPCNEDMQTALENLKIDSHKIVLISNALPDDLSGRITGYVPEEVLAFSKQFQPIILYIGAGYLHYGLSEVIDSFIGISKEFPAAGLIILTKEGGNSQFKAGIVNKIVAKKIAERVLWYCSVPWAVDVMRLSDVLVRATNQYDGDSRAVREALAAGLPVVASNVGYRPKGVILYEAGNSVSLTEKILEVVKNKKKRGHVDLGSEEGRKNILLLEENYRRLLSGLE